MRTHIYADESGNFDFTNAPAPAATSSSPR